MHMALSNKWINKLFANDVLFLRIVRDIGLGLVNQRPKIKKYFIQEASGLIPNNPTLLTRTPALNEHKIHPFPSV